MPQQQIKTGDRVAYFTHSVPHEGVVIAVGGGFVIATSEKDGRTHTQPFIAAVDAVDIV